MPSDALSYRRCILTWAQDPRLLFDPSVGVQLAPNTRLHRNRNGSFGVLYYGARIMHVAASGNQRLFAPRDMSVTTKKRLDSYCHAPVRIRKGVWYVGDQVFFNGILVTPDGPARQTYRAVGAGMCQDVHSLAELAELLSSLELAQAAKVNVLVSQEGNAYYRQLLEVEEAILLLELNRLRKETTCTP